jgi:hypothetical protein
MCINTLHEGDDDDDDDDNNDDDYNNSNNNNKLLAMNLNVFLVLPCNTLKLRTS